MADKPFDRAMYQRRPFNQILGRFEPGFGGKIEPTPALNPMLEGLDFSDIFADEPRKVAQPPKPPAMPGVPE
jgi:hypothetical protein